MMTIIKVFDLLFNGKLSMMFYKQVVKHFRRLLYESFLFRVNSWHLRRSCYVLVERNTDCFSLFRSISLITVKVSSKNFFIYTYFLFHNIACFWVCGMLCVQANFQVLGYVFCTGLLRFHSFLSRFNFRERKFLFKLSIILNS